MASIRNHPSRVVAALSLVLGIALLATGGAAGVAWAFIVGALVIVALGGSTYRRRSR